MVQNVFVSGNRHMHWRIHREEEAGRRHTWKNLTLHPSTGAHLLCPLVRAENLQLSRNVEYILI